MDAERKNIALLSACQALLFINSVTLIAINGLAGYVFGVSIVSSFSSGLLLESNGWQMLNYVAIPFLAIAGLACLWMMLRTRPVAAT